MHKGNAWIWQRGSLVQSVHLQRYSQECKKLGTVHPGECIFLELETGSKSALNSIKKIKNPRGQSPDCIYLGSSDPRKFAAVDELTTP